MEDILKELNSEQLLPVKDTEGAVLVIAGAGSGKTRVLTSRIAYIVDHLGVSPREILAITFTNKAANEMKERLSSMIDGAESMWVMTIHSMCVRILRANIARIGYNENFTIYDDSDKEKVLKRICNENNITDEKIIKNLKYHISTAKNDCLSPEEYEDANPTLRNIGLYCDLFKKYDLHMAHCNALDFDDLLVKTFELLNNDEDVCNYYSDKFKYIHVDEFQDTNKVQLKIIKLLSRLHGNLFAVGDDDQSIYGWRGAEIRNILEFEESFPKAKVYKLERNYRSTKKILDLANTIIANNVGRREKVLWTENGDGAKIEFYLGADEISEAAYTAMQIKSLMSRGAGDYSPKSFAILMRVNALSRAYEQEFTKYGIPFRVYGGVKFFERKEIKDLLAYLKIINNPLDDEALLRIINYPRRGIGDKTIDLLIAYARNTGLRVFDAVMDVDLIEMPESAKKKIREFRELIKGLLVDKEMVILPKLIEILIEKTNFKALFNDNTEESLNKLMNVGEFQNSVEQFYKDNNGATLSEFLNSVTLSTDADDISEDNAVTIATIHAVKGLEFDTVFISGLDETVFPISRAITDPSELEEERRLMYVAITRARSRLYLTRARSRYLFGDRACMTESRFLKEIKHKLGGNSAESERQTTFVSSGDAPKFGGGGYSSSYAKNYIESLNKNNGIKVVESRYKTGVKVRHTKFGEGIIVAVKGSGENLIADVAFKGVGIKSLSVKYAPMEIID